MTRRSFIRRRRSTIPCATPRRRMSSKPRCKLVGREQLALVSSFGTESAALLKVMADVDPAIPVIFLDTGWLFEETLAYRDTLIAALGLRDVRSIKPLEEALLARGSRPRVVVFRSRRLLPHPQSRAAGAGAQAVLGLDQRPQAFSGRRARRDSRRRGRRRAAEIQSVRQCVARRDRGDLCKLAKLPPHPLVASGFLSVGCMPCTSRTAAGRRRACRPLARPRQDGMRHPYDRRLRRTNRRCRSPQTYENAFH